MQKLIMGIQVGGDRHSLNGESPPGGGDRRSAKGVGQRRHKAKGEKKS